MQTRFTTTRGAALQARRICGINQASRQRHGKKRTRVLLATRGGGWAVGHVTVLACEEVRIMHTPLMQAGHAHKVRVVLAAILASGGAAVCLLLDAAHRQGPLALAQTKGLGGQSTGTDGEWLGLPSRQNGYSADWNKRSVGKVDAPVPHHLKHGRFSDEKARYDYSEPDIVGYVPEDQEAVDWTRYPYDDSTYRDGDGLFNNAEPSRGGILAGREPKEDSRYEYFWKVNKYLPSERDIPQDDDRFSSYWKTDNIMGYPEGDLPIRRTYEFDVSTGGKPYDRFWYGQDEISKDVEGVSDYFKDEGRGKPQTDDEQASYDEFWKKDGAADRNRPGYKSYWREDAKLPGNVGGLVDGDEYGDGGLVYLYRRKYDDRRAYDSPAWQHEDKLERGAGEFEEGMGWPEPMYHYGVDSTQHDLRWGDPMRKTTVEY